MCCFLITQPVGKASKHLPDLCQEHVYGIERRLTESCESGIVSEGAVRPETKGKIRCKDNRKKKEERRKDGDRKGSNSGRQLGLKMFIIAEMKMT